MIPVRFLWIGFLLLLACQNSEDPEETNSGQVPEAKVERVACLGTSITYGARQFLTDREKESYPGVLSGLLGNGYMVRNFGYSGSCILKKGNQPYWNGGSFQQAKAFRPTLVILEFGTNDSRDCNWPLYEEEFQNDLMAMVEEMRAQPTHPEVFLCFPPPAFSDLHEVNTQAIIEQIIPSIRKIALKKGLQVIDFHTLFRDREDLFPDGIHPGREGNIQMAKIVAKVLKNNK